MVFSLGLAMIVTAVLAASLVALKQSRLELERTRMDYALAGAQITAAASIIRSGGEGPFRWALATEAGWVEVLAEPEALKLSYDAAARLSDETIGRFQTTAPAAVKAAMAAAAAAGDGQELRGFDSSTLWRDCAASMISPFGDAVSFTFAAPIEPKAETGPPAWRIGEAWRMRVTTTTGWRDERIVRFTGDARHPIATVRRRLTRGVEGESRCDAILQAGA